MQREQLWEGKRYTSTPHTDLRGLWWTSGCATGYIGFALRHAALSYLEVAIMPYDSHQRAAEFHELAAHAHRAAATHHGKEDHLTAHELSRQAMEHSRKAFEASQLAFEKSAAAVKNQPK